MKFISPSTLMNILGRAAFILTILASARVAEGADWQPAKAPLMTPWAAEVNPTNALPDYPRPQLLRTDWENLNGLWDYAITPDSVDQPSSFEGKILVPFPVESALSGVMTNFDGTQQALVSPDIFRAGILARRAGAAAFRRGGLPLPGMGEWTRNRPASGWL